MRRRHPVEFVRRLKIGVSRCISAMSDTKVKLLWTESLAIRSPKTLYALADGARQLTPRAPQLLALAETSRTRARYLVACAEDLERLAIEEAGEDRV